MAYGIPSATSIGEVSTKSTSPSFSSTDLQDLSEAVQRYCFYIEIGIDPKHIAPFNYEWIESSLKLIPQSCPSNLSEGVFRELIENLTDEIQGDYMYSVRKAIMHYVIKNPIERRCAMSRPFSFAVSSITIRGTASGECLECRNTTQDTRDAYNGRELSYNCTASLSRCQRLDLDFGRLKSRLLL
jgi:hypothetical protein